MILYSVKNWNAIYENNRTRELKRLDWVPVPNKQDGDGYTELVSCQDGAAMLGCWVAILQIASKCKPRGVLLRETGEPHSAQSMARMSHLPAGLIGKALPVLVDIKWLESKEYEIPVESRTQVRDSAVPSIPFPSVPFSEEGGPGETMFHQLKAELWRYFKRADQERLSYEDERLLVEIARDVTCLDQWNTIKCSQHSYKRQTLTSLLQNWGNELDKARNYEPPPQKDRQGNVIKPPVNMLMPKMSRLEREGM